MFGKRVGGFKRRAEEVIRGELAVSPELVPIFEALMQARRDILARIAALDSRIRSIAKRHAIVRLLMTTPGVGPITAMAVVAAFDDASRGTTRIRALLKEIMTSVTTDMGATIEAVEADGDRVHLLVNYPPQLALSTLVNGLKGVSSRRLRQKDWPEVAPVLWGTAFWSPSYCVVSCGAAPLDIIKDYVDTQDAPDRDRRGAEQRARRKEKRRGQTEPCPLPERSGLRLFLLSARLGP